MLTPKVMETHPGNQWSDLAFYSYIGRRMRTSGLELTDENILRTFTAILDSAIPAGNA